LYGCNSERAIYSSVYTCMVVIVNVLYIAVYTCMVVIVNVYI